MKLFLDTTLETDWAADGWRRIAASWGGTACEIVSDSAAAEATLITLVDPRRSYEESIATIKAMAPWDSDSDKSFVFDTSDAPAGLFPGLYASLRRVLFSPQRHRTSCYFQSFNEFIDVHPWEPRPPLLFSFQGNHTAPVRARLFEKEWHRSDVLVERTTGFWSRIGHESTREFKRSYAETIGRSRFVLCPKGNGTSSYRLFETMQSGRVPVVIADPWVPCEGVPWNDCSIRVREADVARLVEICESHEHRWLDMALAARRHWETWFSPRGLAQLIATSIDGIRQSRRFPERFYAWEWPLRSGFLRTRRGLVRGKVIGQRLATRLRSAVSH